MFRLFYPDTTNGRPEIESFTFAIWGDIKFESKCSEQVKKAVRDWARDSQPGDCLTYMDTDQKCLLVRVGKVAELVEKIVLSIDEVK